MAIIPDSLQWRIFRRHLLAQENPGFWAHRLTYATAMCQFAPFVRLYAGSQLRDVDVGRYTYFAEGSRCGNVSIGSFCSIGPGTRVGGLGRHPVDMLSTHPAFFSSLKQCGDTFTDRDYFEEQRHTTVGHDVWIGANAIVLDGMDVASGAIVAAGSVVTKPVPAYAIVAGVPARVIRFRFEPGEIAALTTLEWWTQPIDVLRANAAHFRTRNFQQLQDALKAPLNHV